jgi:hypothetical protein
MKKELRLGLTKEGLGSLVGPERIVDLMKKELRLDHSLLAPPTFPVLSIVLLTADS